MLLVTGITGHTGSYFLKELIKNDYSNSVRCIVRENSDTRLIDNSNLSIEKVVGDLNDEVFLKKAFANVDTVIHIYNIHHSPKIVKLALENNVKRAILIHTTGVYSNFKSASMEYKRIEKEVLSMAKNHSDFNLTILRPTMIYGDLKDKNVSEFIKIVDKLKVIPLVNGGKNLIQPVNASDLGRAYYKVLMNPNSTKNKNYDLSGESPISVKDFLGMIGKELNKNSIFMNIPLSVGVFSAKSVRLFSLKKIDYIEKVHRLAEDRGYSHESAVNDFDYETTPLSQGLHKEVKLYKEVKK